MMFPRGAVLAALAAAALAGCSTPAAHDPCALPVAEIAATRSAAPLASGQPEPSSGFRPGLQAVSARRFMVATAHPLASQAACRVLRDGGTAADAAVAAQAMLGLVEPQSSGLGGGAFVLHYEARSGRVTSFDGRETAPAAALPDDLRWISADDRRAPQPDARASGRSIGVPGAVRLMEVLHRAHGRTPWPALLAPAAMLADEGFAVPNRMADAIAAARDALRRDPDAAVYFLDDAGRPRAAGTWLRNPAYADTLRRLAAGGADAFYRGPIADHIVAEVARGAAGALTPGRLTRDDLAAYQVIEREPVCSDYRRWRICGMAPPSSGGLAVAQALGILSRFDLAAAAPQGADHAAGRPTADGAHLLAEALRLAFADRNAYVADPAFVPLPGRGVTSLLDPAYLAQRAALIRLDRSLGTAAPGRFEHADAPPATVSAERGTSHVSIVDAEGNAVSLTTSVEGSLGAYRLVRGFVLNNQLTDFAAVPETDGRPVANRLQGGKRPRSSMAPTLVFERGADGGNGPLVAVLGSPGGAAIIPFVTKTLVGLLDWGWDPQQAGAALNVASFNTPLTILGAEHPALRTDDPLLQALQARGHDARAAALPSGTATILRVPGGWQGGVDPRREGQVLGN